MSINILIADEHTIIRRGMTSMINSLKTSNINTDKLDIDVVGDTSEQAELLNILATQKVDLLFLGYGLTTVKTGNPVSELDGIALVKWISSRYLKTKIIVLSPVSYTHLTLPTIYSV